ncbi:fumarylacetoacetate hydrolase domain-containing protein 2-like [Lingula anatina]|uniref:Fumarylacetoacetate hydrolase domain-containing protein 2-like n=1 Tax=Lingula anatina TaxID=7574 RepID=A0A1S3H3G6_LINAN|nr:fumarylacetoacetate hydrolase domain-containing protein 2-like [Lingula anatina]|eukprot:XP_013379679.1 fumarylacetoacetate hydrolase domain-containing protein 2-like [Lingula anatina]
MRFNVLLDVRRIACHLHRSFQTMRFVQFEEGGRRRVGVEKEDGGDVVDLSAFDKNIPTDMRSFLEGGQPMIQAAKSAVESGNSSLILKRDSVKLLAPVTNPDKVLCVGMNYVDHCAEQNQPVPKEPVLFSKFPSTIIASGDDLQYPEETQELDWEVEMVIVIGKGGKKISENEAMSHVFGYTVAHDVSARDWQMRRNGGQYLVGKSMDCFCPLGPAIVMKEDLSDPHNLGLRCRVNGVTKQDSNTKNLVFKTESIIAFVSRLFTLKAGDIILTGTPPGVGCFRKPPEYLKRGDVVEVEVDQIGKVVNKVV